jgi:hypothetical protein
MALPSLSSSKYELILPSTGEKVEYRPFLVREEKLLLVAQSTGENEDILRAVEDIISSCTFEKLNPKALPFFDLEYVFLQIRAKSVGEVARVKLTCPDDGETKVDVEINLTEVECKREVGHDSNIKLTDDIGIVMSYPRLETMKSFATDDADSVFGLIKGCISQVYDSNTVYDKADMGEKDLDEFIESMSHQQFEKVQQFFATMPKVKHVVKIKNPNTGVESEVVLEGMQSFF